MTRNTAETDWYESAEADMMEGCVRSVGVAAWQRLEFRSSKAKVVRHNRRRGKDKEGKVRTFTTEMDLCNKH